MPISKKDFEQGNFRMRNDGKKRHPIAVFLQKNNKRAFTSDELAKALNMNKNTVHGTLQKLKKEKKIVHKIPYFMWK